jgi:hypothetical protein
MTSNKINASILAFPISLPPIVSGGSEIGLPGAVFIRSAGYMCNCISYIRCGQRIVSNPLERDRPGPNRALRV